MTAPPLPQPDSTGANSSSFSKYLDAYNSIDERQIRSGLWITWQVGMPLVLLLGLLYLLDRQWSLNAYLQREGRRVGYLEAATFGTPSYEDLILETIPDNDYIVNGEPDGDGLSDIDAERVFGQEDVRPIGPFPLLSEGAIAAWKRSRSLAYVATDNPGGGEQLTSELVTFEDRLRKLRTVRLTLIFRPPPDTTAIDFRQSAQDEITQLLGRTYGFTGIAQATSVGWIGERLGRQGEHDTELFGDEWRLSVADRKIVFSLED